MLDKFGELVYILVSVFNTKFMIKSSNLKTITDVRMDPLSILNYAQKTEEPVIILQHSKPKGVFISFEKYHKLMEMVEDYLDARESEEILSDPETKFIPAEQFLKEIGLSKIKQ